MWNDHTLRKLSVRCFSQSKQHWRHTHYGKKPATRGHGSRWDGDRESATNGSTSSGGSHPSSPTSPDYASSISPHVYPKTSLKIVTWNVDFMAANPRTRLSTILEHIQFDIFGCNTDDEQPEPCCILLQEVHPQAFPEILENDWLRQHFCVMPVKADDWGSVHYGNVTLVSRTIPVLGAQLLQFGNSFMGRHALVVDLRMDAPRLGGSSAGTSSASDEEHEVGPRTKSYVTVRVANVHLESLPAGTSFRPVQLSATADMLRGDGIYAGVVAGDMNAITPEDGFIHEEAGLLDAWTGGEEDEEALTWGHQPPNDYPPGRLDKIL